MVRGWYARRVVAKLRDEAVVQVVAMETMMESIAMSGQWNDQYRLNKTDQMIMEDQLQLIETVMAQVTVYYTLRLVSQHGHVGDSWWIRMLCFSP